LKISASRTPPLSHAKPLPLNIGFAASLVTAAGSLVGAVAWQMTGGPSDSPV